MLRLSRELHDGTRRPTIYQPRCAPYLPAIVVLVVLLAACNRNNLTATPPAAPASVTAGAPGDGTPVAGATTNAAPVATAETPSTPAATPPPTPTPLTGRVVLWHSWAQAEGDALAAMLADAQRGYPQVQVDTLFVAPDNLISAYADAVAAGGGPDLLLAPNWWLGDLVEANALLNLDTVVGGNLDETYWPATVASMRYNGSLYGFPLTGSTVALYVNTNLVPPEAIATNTDSLLSTATANPEAGIGLYATLFHTYWGFPAYGAQLVDELGVATLDQYPGAAEYLAWINAMNRVPGSYVAADYGMLLDRYKKGEFAYLVDGPWAIPELVAALGDGLQVVPLPAGPAGSAQPWLTSDGIFVNPTITAEQQIVALNIALFLSSDSTAATLANIGGLLPAARTVDLSAAPLLQGFAAQAATAQAMPATPEMQTIWTYGDDMIIKALTGVADPATIVIETTTLINEANGR